MRQRRQRLQVSTFPFLAVLLCAMGSLILLLLVIDRRAKAVARAKAMRALEQAAAMDAKEDQARRAEWERRRRLLHEQLVQEDQAVLDQFKKLQNETTEVAEKTRAEQANGWELHEHYAVEQSRLAQWENQLAKERGEITKAAQEAETSRAEMARLTADLERLEQTLADLKALRKRQQQLYSLVPYRGKRGDNRKPIYIECTADALIFHPDRHTLLGGSLLPASALRDEIERRLTNAQHEENAYLLMLVRPDGITTYYRAVAAAQGLKIDFGYELIDQDWLLDFPNDEATPARQPWMVTEPTRLVPPNTMPPKKVPGLRPTLVGDLQRQQPEVTLRAGEPKEPRKGASPGSDESGPGPGLFRGENRAGGVSPLSLQATQGTLRGENRAGGVGPLTLQATQGANAPRSVALGGVGIASPIPLREGAASASVGHVEPTETQSEMNCGSMTGGPEQSRERNTDSSDRTADSPTRVTAKAAQPGLSVPGSPTFSPLPGQEQRTANVGAEGTRPALPEARQEGGSEASGTPQPSSLDRLLSRDATKKDGHAGPTRPMLLVGNRDWILFVDCSADGLLLSPSLQHVDLAELIRAKNGSNPLREAVQQVIARRQATVRPGEPLYRPLIRFRVHPEGLRAYYLAYPALEGLGVPMTRENVE